MASTEYPVAQTGSFTCPSAATGIHFETVQLVHTTPVHDVTGTGDVDKKSVSGMSTGEVTAIGHIEASSVVGLAEAGKIADGPAIHAQQWMLRKAWPLFDVTGSSTGTPGGKDIIKNWRHGIPIVSGSMVGVAKNDLGEEMDFTDEVKEIPALSITMSNFGTMVGKCRIMQKQIQASFRDGGPVGAAMSFIFSGAAASATAENFTWLFPSGVTAFGGGNTADNGPPLGTLTIDLDTSTNVIEAAYCYDVTITHPSSIGGRIPCQAKFRFDGYTG